MKNTKKIKIVIGNLKALILNGESCIFSNHYIVKFLDSIDDEFYTQSAGEALDRLDKLAHQVDARESDINHSPFHVMFLNRGLKTLEALSDQDMILPPNLLSIYGKTPSL